jgi:glycosyltransferase involved in cell wall biosynthesis
MRIAFFIKRASRTGSEIALCNLIWYAVNNGVEACVACREGGELLNQLPPNIPVYVYGEWGWAKRTYAGVSRRARGDGNGFTSFVQSKFAPDVWYVNTIIQPDCVSEAKNKGLKCVLHSHELEHMLNHMAQADAATLVSYPQLILATSNACRRVLQDLGRDHDIEVCYPSINPRLLQPDDNKTRNLRRELSIGEKTFVWAMAGTVDPNKNPARFVSIARELLRRGEDVHFIWLGSDKDSYALYIKRKAQGSGFSEKITFAGARTDDYYEWLNVANGVLITSFKESFSLVALEAAYLRKPVVSFDNGGIREVMREGMGIIVDSWNDTDLMQAILRVMNDEIRFDPLVARNRACEFTIEVQGKRWLELLKRYFAE